MNHQSTNRLGHLRQAGLKATLPRLKTLDLFHGSQQRHMTAEDVYRVIFSERIVIGLATVDRVLSQLEQAGLLKRSSFQSDRAVDELDDGSHHDHLVCLDCGRVEEFHDQAIEKRQSVWRGRGLAWVLHHSARNADCHESRHH